MIRILRTVVWSQLLDTRPVMIRILKQIIQSLLSLLSQESRTEPGQLSYYRSKVGYDKNIDENWALCKFILQLYITLPLSRQTTCSQMAKNNNLYLFSYSYTKKLINCCITICNILLRVQLYSCAVWKTSMPITVAISLPFLRVTTKQFKHVDITTMCTSKSIARQQSHVANMHRTITSIYYYSLYSQLYLLHKYLAIAM